MALIETKQDLFDAIGLSLRQAVPVADDRERAQVQIEALIESFLGDLVQGVCDAVVAAAEDDIQSRSGRR